MHTCNFEFKTQTCFNQHSRQNDIDIANNEYSYFHIERLFKDNFMDFCAREARGLSFVQLTWIKKRKELMCMQINE